MLESITEDYYRVVLTLDEETPHHIQAHQHKLYQSSVQRIDEEIARLSNVIDEAQFQISIAKILKKYLTFICDSASQTNED